eukprot:1866817-Amphidinium_carterae.1
MLQCGHTTWSYCAGCQLRRLPCSAVPERLTAITSSVICCASSLKKHASLPIVPTDQVELVMSIHCQDDLGGFGSKNETTLKCGESISRCHAQASASIFLRITSPNAHVRKTALGAACSS